MRAAFGILLPLFLTFVLSPEITLAQPTPADVYVEQAVLEFDEKRYDGALENLRRALQAEPNHREALYYTGVVHMARFAPIRCSTGSGTTSGTSATATRTIAAR